MNDNKLLRPTIYLTAFAIISQVIMFLTQMFNASYFGSTFKMDAFIAANTVPYYLITVFSGSISPILIPLFFDIKTRLGEKISWEIMSSILTYFTIFFIILSIVGIVFSNDLISIFTPGLSSETKYLSKELSLFFWPTLFLTLYIIIISIFYQINEKFIWQAFVPLIGSIVYLFSLIILLPHIGIYGLTLSLLINNLIQAIILSYIFIKDKRIRFTLKVNKSEWIQILHLIYPFILSGFFIRITPLLDRYLASDLPSGTISHLSYAFKINSIIILLVSSAISIVIFPKLSSAYANNDFSKFKETISENMKLMFFFIAPLIGFGFILATPIIRIVLERGMFNPNDTIEVSFFLKIYLFSIIAAGIGSITGKALYSFRMTKLLAIIGTIESILYAIYTFLLVKKFGAIGVPIGYCLFFSFSMVWALLFIRYKIKLNGGIELFSEFFKITISAIISAIILYLLTYSIKNSVIQILIVIILGSILYFLFTNLFGSKTGKKINIMSIEYIRKNLLKS